MILVTGGTGFLGSHVLLELIRKGYSVRATYRTPDHKEHTRRIFGYYQSGEDLYSNIEWISCDIEDYFSVYNAIGDCSVVYHAAGFVSFNDKDKYRLNRLNTLGTANVVNACLAHEIKCLCYVSSIAALGEIAPGVTISESVIWNHGKKASAYSSSKFHGEMEVWRGISEGLSAVIVNPSVITGPGMWFGPGRNLWNSIKKGLKYYTEGSTGYVDVSDVARLMIWLVENEKYGERYIINSDHLNNKELLTLLSDGFGKPAPAKKVTPLIARIALFAESVRALVTGSEKRISRRMLKTAKASLNYSNDKIVSLTGYQFLPLESSIRRSVEAFKSELQLNEK